MPGVEGSGGKGKDRRKRWQNPDPPEFEVSQPSTDQSPQGGVAIDGPRLGTPPVRLQSTERSEPWAPQVSV